MWVFWKQMPFESWQHGCVLFSMYWHWPQASRQGLAGFFFKTEPNRILHSSSLTAAADCSVPPRPPAQEGPIKTSHIDSLTFAFMCQVCSTSWKKKNTARTKPERVWQSQWIAVDLEKNLPVWTLTLVVLPLWSPLPPYPALHVFLTERSLAEPSSSCDLRGRKTEGKAVKFLLIECQAEAGSGRGQMNHREIYAGVEKNVCRKPERVCYTAPFTLPPNPA